MCLKLGSIYLYRFQYTKNMLLLNFRKGNGYNYWDEVCHTLSTMIVTRLRSNRIKKGDLRISLIRFTTFNNEQKS